MSRGGGSSSNDKLIKQQEAEAAKAERDKVDREERMRYGRDMIDARFNGGWVDPVKQHKKVPYTVNVSKKTGEKAVRTGHGDDQQHAYVPVYSTSKETRYTDPQLVAEGEKEYVKGIGDDFYDGYYDTIVDYYMDDLDQQHADAKQENLFDLARRGVSTSSMSAEKAGDIATEYGEGKLAIANIAQGQKDQLIDDVNTAQDSAYALLQGAEDPTAAIDAATREATAIQNKGPDLSSPLGQMFTAALNSYNNYNAVAQAKRFNRTPITPRSPTASSGSNIA